MIKKIILGLIILIGMLFIYYAVKKGNFNPIFKIGQPIDSLNNVKVYYNGGVDNVVEREIVNGYNLGLKYQCVEFVKRYYFEYYNHKMTDSYGHAISFYNTNLIDGKINEQRGLFQYSNPSKSRPKEGDLIIMKGSIFNKYGHVAIISKVNNNEIEIIQQNPGPYSPSRDSFKLSKNEEGKWKIKNERILGWLRK